LQNSFNEKAAEQSAAFFYPDEALRALTGLQNIQDEDAMIL
jgi:hypothetical protein